MVVGCGLRHLSDEISQLLLQLRRDDQSVGTQGAQGALRGELGYLLDDEGIFKGNAGGEDRVDEADQELQEMARDVLSGGAAIATEG